MSDFLEAVKGWAAEGWQTEYETDPSIETAVRLRVTAEQIRSLLRQAVVELDLLIVDVLGKGQADIPGVGRVEVRSRATGVKWDSEGVLRILAAQALDERQVDPETGEMLERPEDALLRVLRECSPITTPSHAWRAATRVRLGDRLDEYQQVGKFVDVVTVTPMVEEVAS